MPLFVLVSQYRAELVDVDRARSRHHEWSAGLYASGQMLVSGRQEPPVGGVLILRARDREEVEQMLAVDPFHAEGLAEYQITQFSPGPFPVRSAAFDAWDSAPASADRQPDPSSGAASDAGSMD